MTIRMTAQNTLWAATTLALTLTSSSAFGFVHSQLLVGSARGTFAGGEGLTGSYRTSEVTAAFQFDYFPPQIPVTFGIFLGHKAMRLSETGSSINRADQWSLGPEMMAWYPGYDFKPYIKGGIGFGSYTALEAGSVSSGSRAWYSSFARRASLGLKWDRFPEFAPLIEYHTSREELESEGATSGLTPNQTTNLNSKSLLVGFESSF